MNPYEVNLGPPGDGPKFRRAIEAIETRCDFFGPFEAHKCQWVDAFADVLPDDVPAGRREEAERLVAEACAYFGLPPMRVLWRRWVGSVAMPEGMLIGTDQREGPYGTITPGDRGHPEVQAREEEVRRRDQSDPARWGWVWERDPRPTAIHLRADLPVYPLASAVRYAVTRAYQRWAGFEEQLDEAELHEMAIETITHVPKLLPRVEPQRQAGQLAVIAHRTRDGRVIGPLGLTEFMAQVPPLRTFRIPREDGASPPDSTAAA